jgi:tRNA 5-methylaminomethyl-2-thiouridine biosynthesis bifunctional protein
MLTLGLPDEIAHAVSAEAVAQTTGVETGCGGIHYPAGGWLCPAQLTAAVLVAQRQGLCVHFHPVTNLAQQDGNGGWILPMAASALTPASCWRTVTTSAIYQTEKLPVYPVGGQVSHIPTTAKLGELRQVLCYDGYLTPQNPRNQHHCIGASYHRGQEETPTARRINSKTPAFVELLPTGTVGERR